MKMANVAEFRAHFGEILAQVERGEEVSICKRNKPVARLVRIDVPRKANATQLGCARGSVRIMCDLTEPAIQADQWEMHR
jgi:prevent-host-death family protein